HHIFDAADGAFSAHLSGAEAAELRRWLIGPGTGRRRSRARGLEQRIGDLVAGDDAAARTLAEVLRAAQVLPTDGWPERLARDNPVGPVEAFLARVRAHVYARSEDEASPYSLEATTLTPSAELLGTAEALEAAFARLETPVRRLIRLLAQMLDEEAAELDTAARLRIEAACRGLNRRAEMVLGAWRAMLRALAGEPEEAFVDWFGIERSDGRDVDVGMHRHWLDPTVPFAEAVLKRAHGVLITSATLRDRPPDVPDDWSSAEVRTGALHLPQPAKRTSLPSPFDYAGETRIIVVTDVRRNDAEQMAAAYRELFLAAGGGGLGLFTAINRLRQVQGRIAGPLEAAGIPLLAQHVDLMDTGTLVDIFRAEVDSCLLGTDAVRDGVDVPGRSLRLIVFDRVPWPRPDILHRARKAVFGGRAYDDMVTRLRLKQAYGRLIRSAGDRGVFVVLDAMLPSRLTTAFPDGVTIRRLGLAEAVRLTAEFLGRR
ncbi:MAG TPA: helicase C-terminal domain-containing protein, partial [Alphaproteobacteria bacterium]|nr:helicase C-terminal domain-containing protein [Alphaproteobacteria bacterium]